MGRGSTRKLIRKLVGCLAKSSKSIKEISDETELDRTAIVTYLKILKECGLLVENQEGTKKIFSIVPTYRTDTYFGLPLGDEEEKNAETLYYLIRKNWKEQTTKPLFKTHAQKIAYKVITNCKLEIPIGWYIYGGVCIMSYEDTKEYSYQGFSDDIEKCIKEITTEFVKNDYAWESKKQQYDEMGIELYKIKEDILSILYSPDFRIHSKNSLFVLVKKLRKLSSLAPQDTRKEYVETMGAYQDLMLDITNKLDENIILEHTREITLLFEAIWRYIALFNFKQNLREYYPEKVLNSYFELDILQQETEIMEVGTKLQQLVPEDVITDPIKKKLNDALSKMKSGDNEELKKQVEELEKFKKEKGLKKFNEEIFKKMLN